MECVPRRCFAGDIQLGENVYQCSVIERFWQFRGCARNKPQFLAAAQRRRLFLLMRDFEGEVYLLRISGKVSLTSSRLPAQQGNLQQRHFILRNCLAGVLHYLILSAPFIPLATCRRRCSFQQGRSFNLCLKTMRLRSRCSSKEEASTCVTCQEFIV